jgi:hypothetical protein
LKKFRASNNPTREEIREHMLKHDELIKSKLEASKQLMQEDLVQRKKTYQKSISPFKKRKNKFITGDADVGNRGGLPVIDEKIASIIEEGGSDGGGTVSYNMISEYNMI